MLTAYIVATVVAGAFILLSALAGGHDAGHDVDVGHDFDADAPDHDFDVHHENTGELTADTWIPFFSLRFWTYFAATFGLIGLILTLLRLADPITTFVLSISVGFGMGLLVAYLMRVLKNASTTSSAGVQDLLGKEAKMLVGVKTSQLGKVRFEVKGEIIDMIAVTEDGSEIESGEEVLIVGIEGNQARVARRRDIFEE